MGSGGMAMLLGGDGKGLELALKLESHGVWRSWLGDSLYQNFTHSLSSPSSWDSFINNNNNSTLQIQLQLRVRALLFDKATLSLFLRIPPSFVISHLNPNYLQLHGDDIYFTLEDVSPPDSVAASIYGPSKVHTKPSFGVGSRYGEPDMDSMSHRFTQEDFPETWYTSFIDKHRSTKPYVLSSFNWDSDKRCPGGMLNYLRHVEKHKRRRIAFNGGNSSAGFGNSSLDSRSSVQFGSISDVDTSDDETLFPENMFMNCVPDVAIAASRVPEDRQEVEFYGVLDRLPQMATKNSIMIERLGISMDQGPGSTRTNGASAGNRRRLSQDQALLVSKKVIARALASAGFDGSTEVPVEVLSQLFSCHICKLGSMLKILADTYRKKYSAIELIKMFLRVSGHSNLAILAEYCKNGRNIAQQFVQQGQISSQLPMTHPNGLHMPQVPRPIQSQIQPMKNPQNLIPQQQQLLRMRRGTQVSTPKTAIGMDKERPLVEVKLETPDFPMDNNAFSTMNSRQQQLQHQRQQQQQQQMSAPLQRFQPQTGAQYRQLSPMQIAQMQTMNNMGVARAPPVKVEGFQELMGGDSSLKHDPDDSKRTSPKS